MRTSALLPQLLLAALLAGCRTDSAPAPDDSNLVNAPPTNDVSSLALSPDGRTLAIVSRHLGRNHLWLQQVGTDDARPLAGTEEAAFPFWSPDGTQLGFFSRNEVRSIDIGTGQIRTVAAGAAWPAGGTWNSSGMIVFASHGSYMLTRVDARGGATSPLTLPGPDQFALVQPHFLPDGRHFLFYAQGTPERRGVYLGRIDAAQTWRLADSEAAGVYAGGKVFYLQNGMLHARALDTEAKALQGEDQVIGGPVPLGSRSVAALSANGSTVIYRTGPAGSARQLTWFSRDGQQLGTVGAPYLPGAGAPSLSPDGSQVVINYILEGMGEIGIVDMATGQLTDVTNHPANDSYPIWSADGTNVLFSSKRTLTYEMYRQSPDSEPEKVFPDVGLRHPMDMTRDGNLLVFRMNNPDLWVRNLATGQDTNLIPPGRFKPQWPQLSPDGRWIAFQSSVEGGKQIHLRGPIMPPNQPGETSAPLTSNGGGWVRWRGDGRELYYAEADGTLMAIGITFSDDGRRFTATDPVRLFTAPMGSSPEDDGLAQQFMVSSDGQRFLVVAAPEARSPVRLLHVNLD